MQSGKKGIVNQPCEARRAHLLLGVLQRRNGESAGVMMMVRHVELVIGTDYRWNHIAKKKKLL